MAKSAVRVAVDDTWNLLEDYGRYMRDARLVAGYGTGHQGGGPVMDDDTALRIEEAVRWLMQKDDRMCMVVLMYFRGEKLRRTAEGNVPVVYYAQRGTREIAEICKQSNGWAHAMLNAGVARLDGRLSL